MPKYKTYTLKILSSNIILVHPSAKNVSLENLQFKYVTDNCHTACITILPSDDPYGVFSFEELSLSRTISEPQGAPSTANGKPIEHLLSVIILCAEISMYHMTKHLNINFAVAQLTVVRNRGLFGQVTVPFEVRQMGSQQGTHEDTSCHKMFYCTSILNHSCPPCGS